MYFGEETEDAVSSFKVGAGCTLGETGDMAFRVMGASGYFWCTFGIHREYGIQTHGRFWVYFGEETEDTESRVMGGFGGCSNAFRKCISQCISSGNKVFGRMLYCGYT